MEHSHSTALTPDDLARTLNMRALTPQQSAALANDPDVLRALQSLGENGALPDNLRQKAHFAMTNVMESASVPSSVPTYSAFDQ